MMKSSAASALGRFGAKPPSSPTLVLWPAFFNSPRSAWRIPEPQRSASAKVLAPTGRIMNSWKSIGVSACTPPLMMFIIGTGRGRAEVRAADRGQGGRRRARRARVGDGRRRAERGGGGEPALVRRAVEFDHGLVDL